MKNFQLLLILLLSSLLPSAHCSTSVWLKVHDDLLGEFSILNTFDDSRLINCLARGDRVSTAHAVQFDEVGKLCRLFACNGGWHGCRKCRNIRNSSLPLVWVRTLSDGPSCWRTFQHRVDESVDFDVSWTQFVSEFGQGESANFWIGLETLHLITAESGGLPVRWEFSDWDDKLYWMENEFFRVAGVSAKYRVSVGRQLMDRSTVQQCSTSSPSHMNNSMFSAKDQDNDESSSGNCAMTFGGGWWHKGCYCMNPNGPYVRPPEALSLTSFARGICLKNDALVSPWNHRYSLKTFECLLMVELN